MLLTMDVTTVLPDRREDDLGHPVLELLALWFVGAHGELLETTLGERHQAIRAGAQAMKEELSDPITFQSQSLLCRVEVAKHRSRLGDAEGFADIRTS